MGVLLCTSTLAFAVVSKELKAIAIDEVAIARLIFEKRKDLSEQRINLSKEIRDLEGGYRGLIKADIKKL
ncbi:MAG: hypothetical protein LBQ04_00720 [Endomicrobium sp.]|nr:hypothetical protein [Endomicrobium sp.]